MSSIMRRRRGLNSAIGSAPVLKIGLRNHNLRKQEPFSLETYSNPAVAGSFNHIPAPRITSVHAVALEGGPTNRWREAAAIFGEGEPRSRGHFPASLPSPNLLSPPNSAFAEFGDMDCPNRKNPIWVARQIRPSLKGYGVHGSD